LGFGASGRFVAGFFAADDGQRLDGFGGDGVDGVEALGEQGLEFGGLSDFGFVGRGGEEVRGFDDFFVELEPFAIARGGLFEGLVDDLRDAVEADGATGKVIAIDGAENFFGSHEGERVRLFGGTHAEAYAREFRVSSFEFRAGKGKFGLDGVSPHQLETRNLPSKSP
jgi:hypothetical protein